MSESDEWDTELAEQDQFNRTNFSAVDSLTLEKKEKLESIELQQATFIKQEKQEDLGWTAQRNALKEQEKAARIKKNPLKSVPLPQEEEEEEEIPYQSQSASNAAGGGKLKILDPELKAFFEESESKQFSEQAVDFLNAYWPEVGDQAEFIFAAAFKWFVEADMHTRGITLRHMYEEGSSVDYNVAAYFYEKLYNWMEKTKEGRAFRDDPTYAPSMLKMKTAIQLKKDFREKVDVSFDGKISFLEHLLYQYNTVANPQDFMKRRKAMEDEHELIQKARAALDDINLQIKRYEAKRSELEEGAKMAGVKGLKFKHELSMLDASPLAEALQKSLITAEAAVRIAVKHYQGKAGKKGGGAIPEGSLWWMKRELKAKKEVVVPATLRRAKR